jgi:hypothetical protein
VLNDSELVHSGQVGDGLSSILGVSSKLEGVGSVERSRGSDLSKRGGLGTLQGGLLGELGLGLLRLNGGCGRETVSVRAEQCLQNAQSSLSNVSPSSRVESVFRHVYGVIEGAHSDSMMAYAGVQVNRPNPS